MVREMRGREGGKAQTRIKIKETEDGNYTKWITSEMRLRCVFKIGLGRKVEKI